MEYIQHNKQFQLFKTNKKKKIKYLLLSLRNNGNNCAVNVIGPKILTSNWFRII